MWRSARQSDIPTRHPHPPSIADPAPGRRTCTRPWEPHSRADRRMGRRSIPSAPPPASQRTLLFRICSTWHTPTQSRSAPCTSHTSGTRGDSTSRTHPALCPSALQPALPRHTVAPVDVLTLHAARHTPHAVVTANPLAPPTHVALVLRSAVSQGAIPIAMHHSMHSRGVVAARASHHDTSLPPS